MSLRNCSVCGKLCLDNPTKMCPDCIEQEERDEDTVARFIRDKGQTSILEIHEATGIEERVILRMIKRGRIQSQGIVEYPCDSCGAPILEGRLCDTCSTNITSQIKREDWAPTDRAESKRQSHGMYSYKPPK